MAKTHIWYFYRHDACSEYVLLMNMHLLMKIPDAENFTDVILVTDAVMEFMVDGGDGGACG